MRNSSWLVILFVFLCASLARGQYVRDILGSGYEKYTIEMPEDEEGDVVCTLVRKQHPEQPKQAVLYVHGYNDYFFQSQLGDSLLSQGYNFYAVDLRRYGRSLLQHQDAFYCYSLDEYFADIDTSLAIIRKEGNERIILMGHSTGGLITSYYLKHHPNAPVSGLILNSPFLDWNFGWWMEAVAFPVVSFLAKFFPQWVVQGDGTTLSMYACSLLSDYYGEWTFNTKWKMSYGHRKKAGWIHAIQMAQQDIQRKCDIQCPILLLSSDCSLPETSTWSDEYLKADIVLSVDDIQHYGAKLGKDVSAHQIKGGIHDLILSPRPARDETYQLIFEWLKRIK